MSDRLLLPLTHGRWLALSGDAFEAALCAGAEAMAAQAAHGAVRGAAAVEPLLSAEEAAPQLGVTARWLEDSARAGIVPHYKLGATRRFRVSDVAAHFAVAGAPPRTDCPSVGVAPSRSAHVPSDILIASGARRESPPPADA